MENLKLLFALFLISVFSLTANSKNLDSLMECGKKALNEKNHDLAEQLYQDALILAEDKEDTEKRAKIYNNLGIIHKREGNYSASIENYGRALYLRRQLGVDSLTGGTLYNFALVLKKNGFYELALEKLDEAMKIFVAGENLQMEAKSLDAIGNLYFKLDDYENANAYHKMAVEIFQTIGDTNGLSLAFNNIGELYIEMDSLVQAEYYLNQSAQLKQILGRSLLALEVLKGEMFLKQEKWDSAYFYYEKTLAERLENGDKGGYVSSYYHLGEYYLKINDLKKANVYLDTAYQWALNLEDPSMMIEIIGVQIEVAKLQKNYPFLTQKFEEFIALKEEVLGENSRVMAAYFNSEYKFLERENQLKIEQQENAIKTTENKNLTYRNKVLLGIVITFIVLVILIFFLSLKMRRNNVLLKEQHDTIQDLHFELNHRTNNYYQMLSGMLLYDIDEEEDPNVEAMLRRYVSRVNSMAQIQHYLIANNPERKSVVSLDEYLSDLIDEIDLALNHASPKVSISKHLESIQLNYNKTCYVAIAVNELLQNAFKHSFKHISEPEIHISLNLKSEKIVLVIADNGVGMEQVDQAEKSVSGIKLITQLVAKIKGKITYKSNRENGLEIELILPQ